MDEIIYCPKQETWIRISECPEPDCALCLPQEALPETLSLGDGDGYGREDDEEDFPDAAAASVTVHIPETDQSCHFGPDWASDDDETSTFLEISLEELFGVENAPDEEADDGEEESVADEFGETLGESDTGEGESGENDWESAWEGGEYDGGDLDSDGGEE